MLASVAALGAACGAGPAQADADLYGLTNTGQLVRFNASQPGVMTPVAPVSGLAAGDSLVMLDWSSGFGLSGLSGSGVSVDLNPSTGEGRPSGGFPALLGFSGASTYAALAPGKLHGVGNQMGPAPAGFQPARLTYDGNPDATPVVTSIVPAVVSLHGTTYVDRAYGVDEAFGTLVGLGSSGPGLCPCAVQYINTIGRLGIPVTDPVAIVIPTSPNAPSPTMLLATRPPASSTSALYSVDLHTGAATPIGSLPSGVVLQSMAYVPPPTLWTPLDNTPRVYLPGGYLVADLGETTADAEAATNSFILRRSGDTAPAFTVDYTVTTTHYGNGADAVPGRDFMPTSGSLTFAAGQREATVPLRVLDSDASPATVPGSPGRYFVVDMSSPDPGVVFNANQDHQQVTIDDFAPGVTAANLPSTPAASFTGIPGLPSRPPPGFDQLQYAASSAPLALGPTALATATQHTASVTATCTTTTRCRGTLELLDAASRRLASGKLSIPSLHTKAIRLRLTSRATKALRRSHTGIAVTAVLASGRHPQLLSQNILLTRR